MDLFAGPLFLFRFRERLLSSGVIVRCDLQAAIFRAAIMGSPSSERFRQNPVVRRKTGRCQDGLPFSLRP
jgi:hypothetical protein